jgi:hypothetical protein
LPPVPTMIWFGRVVRPFSRLNLRDDRLAFSSGMPVDRGVLGSSPLSIARIAASLDVVGRVEVRLAGAEADHVAAGGFQLARLVGHRDGGGGLDAAQLQRALEGVARLADRERRTLSIQLDGTGARKVRVGFVAGAPLWKATYRAMLPADPQAKTARLQGWAVLENESGEDWKGVDLTLVSGNPVTFRQALYAPFHVDRPVVPVEVWGRVTPAEPDRGAAPMAPMAAAPVPPAALRSGGALGRLERGQASPVDASAETLVRMAPQQADIVASAAIDGQTQISFRVPGSISVRNGDSMMVPLISQEVPAERVALFRAERGRHPLASLRLQNAGTMPLPPGVLAIFAQGADGAAEFVGDARLAPLPAGESRLVSYAIDYKTRIDVVPANTTRIDRMRALDACSRSSTRSAAASTMP